MLSMVRHEASNQNLYVISYIYLHSSPNCAGRSDGRVRKVSIFQDFVLGGKWLRTARPQRGDNLVPKFGSSRNEKPMLLEIESVSHDDWLAQRHDRVCRWPARVRPLGRIRTNEKSRSDFGFGRMPKEIRMVVRWPCRGQSRVAA